MWTLLTLAVRVVGGLVGVGYWIAFLAMAETEAHITGLLSLLILVPSLVFLWRGRREWLELQAPEPARKPLRVDLGPPPPTPLQAKGEERPRQVRREKA